MNSISPTDDEGLDYFTCSTLIDITKTDAVRHYNKGMPEDKTDYEIMRNQQRNYQSIIQVIGLRGQPVYLSAPTTEFHTKLSNLGFGSEYTTGTVWTFHFGVEQQGLFDSPDKKGGLLIDDLHNVPVVTDLTEDVTIDPSILNTVDDKFKNTIISK